MAKSKARDLHRARPFTLRLAAPSDDVCTHLNADPKAQSEQPIGQTSLPTAPTEADKTLDIIVDRLLDRLLMEMTAIRIAEELEWDDADSAILKQHQRTRFVDAKSNTSNAATAADKIHSDADGAEMTTHHEVAVDTSITLEQPGATSGQDSDRYPCPKSKSEESGGEEGARTAGSDARSFAPFRFIDVKSAGSFQSGKMTSAFDEHNLAAKYTLRSEPFRIADGELIELVAGVQS